jgi:hypothetical protein
MYPHLSPRPEPALEGYSYAGLIIRAPRGEVLRHAAAARFTGWVGPQEGDWVVVVPARVHGAVAAGRADLDAFAAGIARRLDEVVLTAAVEKDRLLRLAMWAGSSELGRYLSDPAYGAEDDDDLVFPEPEGVEHAEEFAAVCGQPDNAEDLAEVLGDVLDEESQIESERLASTLRLLGLPRWLVAGASPTKDVPGGPRASQFTRLYRGRTGIFGRVLAALARLVRWH